VGRSTAMWVQFGIAAIGGVFVAAGTFQQDDVLAGAMFASAFSFPYLVYLAVGRAYQRTTTAELALKATVISGALLLTTSMLLHGFLFSRVPGSSTDSIAAIWMLLFQALIAAPIGFLVTGRH
jgi:hypothetical protein